MKNNFALTIVFIGLLFINIAHAVDYNLYRVHSEGSDLFLEIEVHNGWVNVNCSRMLANSRQAKIQAELLVNNNKYQFNAHGSVRKTGRCRLVSKDSVSNIAADLISADSVYLNVKIDNPDMTFKVGGSPLMRWGRNDGVYHENAAIDALTQSEVKSKQIENTPPKKSTPKTKSDEEYISQLPDDLRNIQLIEITSEMKQAGKQKSANLGHHLQDKSCLSAAYVYARSFSYWQNFYSHIATANNFVKASKTGLPKFTRENAYTKCSDESHLAAIHKNQHYAKNSMKWVCDMAGPGNQRNYIPPDGSLAAGVSRKYCWDRELIEQDEERSCLRTKNTASVKTPGLTVEKWCECSGKRVAESYIAGHVSNAVSVVTDARRVCDAGVVVNPPQTTSKKSQAAKDPSAVVKKLNLQRQRQLKNKKQHQSHLKKQQKKLRVL